MLCHLLDALTHLQTKHLNLFTVFIVTTVTVHRKISCAWKLQFRLENGLKPVTDVLSSERGLKTPKITTFNRWKNKYGQNFRLIGD